MTYAELKQHINSLITDSTTTEQAEQIGKLLSNVDDLEKEHNAIVQSKAELNKKYVEAIKNNSFAFTEQPKAENKPLTIDECLEAVIKQRK